MSLSVDKCRTTETQRHESSVVSRSALAEELERIARDTGVNHYHLKDERSYTNWGASGGGQSVIIQILSDPGVQMVAEYAIKGTIMGIASGAASLFTKQVIEKAQNINRQGKEASRRYEEQMAGEHGHPIEASPEIELAESGLLPYIWRGTQYTANAYGLAREDLTCESSKQYEDSTQLTLVHELSGDRFSVKVNRDISLLYIRKLESREAKSQSATGH